MRARNAVLLAPILIVLLGLPLAAGEHFFIQLMTNFFIFSILSMSLQLLIGTSGILSLGHAAFFGIGAYGSGILSVRYGVSFPLALLFGTLLAAFAGLLMSPIIRLREVYFAIGSFAFGIIVAELFSQWKTLTGGHDGLIMIPFASIGSFTFDQPSKFYYLAGGFALAHFLLFTWLARSPLGRALSAMRQNEQAAISIGLNLTALKAITIVMAAASAGLAGGLFAHLLGSITPHTFGWQQSINLLTMVVIGGGAAFGSVVLATFILLFIPELFRSAAEYSTLINGIVLVLFMVLLPNGLSGISRWLDRIGIRQALVLGLRRAGRV